MNKENKSKQGTSKAALRKKMRALLSELSPESIAMESVKICQHIARISHTNKLLANAQTIALFSAHGAEVGLASLHQILTGKTLVYPRCRGEGLLSFHRVSNHAELTPGLLGIPEPEPHMHEEVPLQSIDLFFCPGLAFTKNGIRLGHGGGYYDRTLENLTSPRCGVALQCQITDSIPHMAHDIMMDFILTENGLLSTRLD